MVYGDLETRQQGQQQPQKGRVQQAGAEEARAFSAAAPAGKPHSPIVSWQATSCHSLPSDPNTLSKAAPAEQPAV